MNQKLKRASAVLALSALINISCATGRAIKSFTLRGFIMGSSQTLFLSSFLQKKGWVLGKEEGLLVKQR